MVGFGSSLRMGRRTGWEGAYLDYETLKLLLSQTEAVYEEQATVTNNNHNNNNNRNVGFGEDFLVWEDFRDGDGGWWSRW